LSLYIIFLLSLTSFVLLNFSPATEKAFDRYPAAKETLSDVFFYLAGSLLAIIIAKALISLIYVSGWESERASHSKMRPISWPLLPLSDLLGLRANTAGYGRDLPHPHLPTFPNLLQVQY